MAERIKFEKTVKVLKGQDISQMKQLIELQNKHYDLEAELKTLRYEAEENLQSLSKLNDFEFKFVKMLTRQKTPNDKHGISYRKAKNNYKNHTTFVKSSSKYRRAPTCSYCCKQGHLKFA